MYKLSQLIGKQSISLQNADSQGVVCNAFFDKNLLRVRYLLLLSDDEDTRFFVDFKNLSSVHQDAVVITSSSALVDAPLPEGYVANPINLPAYNQDGKSLGIIRDITLEDENVQAFVTDSGEIPAGTMLSRSDAIVVFNDTGAPIKIKKTKPAKSSAANNSAKKDTNKVKDTAAFTAFPKTDSAKNTAQKSQTADLLNGDEPTTDLQQHLQPVGEGFFDGAEGEGKKPPVGTPPRVMPPQGPPPVRDPSLAKFSFLLGKRLQRSIYAARGFLIAREDDMVTEAVIKRAKENGKLVAIALHSL